MIVLKSGATYAKAARQLREGQVSANPLALALLESGYYALEGDVSDQIVLRDIRTGQRYTGTVPDVLAHYPAGFWHGRRVIADHEFELVLVSEAD